MGSFMNPTSPKSAQTQGGLYYARRRRKATGLLQSLTKWSHGLTVESGQYVSSENGTSAWQATTNGTSGTTAPTGQGLVDDGGVEWKRVDVVSLLPYLFSGVPTP